MEVGLIEHLLVLRQLMTLLMQLLEIALMEKRQSILTMSILHRIMHFQLLHRAVN